MNVDQWARCHFIFFLGAQHYTLHFYDIVFVESAVFFFKSIFVHFVCFLFLSSISFSIRFIRYNIVFLVLTYGIPMLIMVVCYTIMGKVLWGSKSIGEHTQRQIESIKSKKKVCALFSKIVFILSPYTKNIKFNKNK